MMGSRTNKRQASSNLFPAASSIGLNSLYQELHKYAPKIKKFNNYSFLSKEMKTNESIIISDITPPSTEQIARNKPMCLGANLMSVTLVRESTRLVRFTQ